LHGHLTCDALARGMVALHDIRTAIDTGDKAVTQAIRRKKALSLALVAALGGGMFVSTALFSTAVAKTPPKERPEIFNKLLDCRTVTDNVARLACYDQQVAAMETAAQRDEVVILDKDGLNKTRRTLFGFSFPKLPFLGGDNDDRKPEFSTIEAKITAARQVGYGNWSFRLEDGAEWQTIEPISNRVPRAGMAIEIKRGTLGSYIGKIGDWPAVRMKRVG